MNELSRKQKGEIAELEVALEATRKGWIVNRPLSVARYDLILDDGKKLYRTQVKYANGKATHSTGAVTCTANNGPYSPERFSKDEIDVVIAYVPKIDSLIWIGPEYFDGKTICTIRLEPSKNGQSKGVFLAEDHIW